MRRSTLSVFLLSIVSVALACDPGATTTPPDEPGGPDTTHADADADGGGSKRHEGPDRAVLLRGATVWTATGESFAPGAVLLVNDEIAAVGPVAEVAVPEGFDPEALTIVELEAGQVVTPGIIDTHSHMGVYASPGLRATSDGNETAGAITPYVRAEDGFWAQDPQLNHALAGGVTTAQILPGSANLIGGRGFTIKLRPGGRSAEDFRFEDAPAGLKMACGENPKRVYGDRGGPVTRMGNVAGYRKAFQEALEYKQHWEAHARKLAKWERKQSENAKSPNSKRRSRRESKSDSKSERPEPPARDFGLETLAAVLRGEILVHMHCYRADEMSLMLDLAASYGFSIRSFHHAVEAYKIADRLGRAGTAASVWADWWGFKAEAYDGVRENAAMISRAGARAIIHSDSPEGIQRLNQEAGKALSAGRRAGIEISDDEALRWLTVNPAWALGVGDETGSLEVGKDADVVVWNREPFSVYAKAQLVFIDGELAYDREGALGRPRSDFDLGLRDDLKEAP